MKKQLLFAGLLFVHTITYAESRLGFKVSPNVSFGRVHTDPDTAGFASAGAAFGVNGGIVYDCFVHDNYCISSGLFYACQHLAIENEKLVPPIKEVYSLHYLQLPLLLKLHTSELTLDTRLYVAMGFVGQLRINERTLEHEGDRPFIKGFSRWGAALSMGTGVEYDFSFSTSIFAGISYQLGLSNAFSKQESHPQHATTSKLMGYGDQVSIDLGVRF
jgi:hypothetical protein